MTEEEVEEDDEGEGAGGLEDVVVGGEVEEGLDVDVGCKLGAE